MSLNGLDDLKNRRAAATRTKPTPRHPRPEPKAEQPEGGSDVDRTDEAAKPETDGADQGQQPQAEVDPDAGKAEVDPPEQAEAVTDPPSADEVGHAEQEPPLTTVPPTGDRQERQDVRTGARRTRTVRRPAARSTSSDAAPGVVTALRGEDERKMVEVDALSWAASVRKAADREQQVIDSIREALTAGAPPELLVAALIQAEAKAQTKFSQQVWNLVQPRRQAR
ncbi:MAG: hypothetical protein HOV94_43985 [Saccharothrix sp.]|nr:hypothetical protein [Saccharothrix sp.]